MISRNEERWLWQMVRWAFLVRALLALAFHVTGLSLRLAPDEETYAAAGRAITAYWSGDLFTMPWRLSSQGPLAYFYLNAASWFLFGSVIPLKLVNCAVGALACRPAYFLARSLSNEAAARRTALFVAFFPSLMLWASLNIRDVWVVLLVLYVGWKGYQLTAQPTLASAAQLIVALVLINNFRQYLYYVVAVPVVAAMIIGKRGHLLRNTGLALLAGLAVVLLAQHGLASRALDLMDLETIATKRRGMMYAADSSYGQDADISTPGKALAFLPIGLAYFWLSPFPWQITSFLKVLSLPEVLLVYYLTPSVIRGITHTIKHRLAEAMQVLLLTALLTVSYSLGSGNVGTLFRHRAQAMAFYLIFSSIGTVTRRVPSRAQPAVVTPEESAG